MNTVRIYGASDDLVEVEGDVPGCNEYGSFDGPLYVEFSTGLAFRVEYTEAGVWAVERVRVGGSGADGTTVAKEPHGTGADPEPYTETVTVTGPFEWVEVWESFPPGADDLRRKLAERLPEEDAMFDPDHLLTEGEVAAVWAIVGAALRRGAKR